MQNLDLVKCAIALTCPAADVAANWPAVETCLEALGVYTRNTAIAALATIAVETAYTFRPIHELGGADYLNHLYDTRVDLGNTPGLDGDGARYCGRGYVQITGQANYLRYGRMLGIDLVADPDRALEPNVAASIFAAYFHDHRVNVAADAGDWVKVRRLINGGTNGLQQFTLRVKRLEVLAQ